MGIMILEFKLFFKILIYYFYLGKKYQSLGLTFYNYYIIFKSETPKLGY